MHAQSLCHLTLCNPMDCSPPGSSVYEVFQARILEQVAISSSRRPSQLRDETHVSCISWIGRWILYPWEAPIYLSSYICIKREHHCSTTNIIYPSGCLVQCLERCRLSDPCLVGLKWVFECKICVCVCVCVCVYTYIHIHIYVCVYI